MIEFIKTGLMLSLFIFLNLLRYSILVISLFSLYSNIKTKNSRGIIYSIIGFILYIVIAVIIHQYY